MKKLIISLSVLVFFGCKKDTYDVKENPSSAQKDVSVSLSKEDYEVLTQAIKKKDKNLDSLMHAFSVKKYPEVKKSVARTSQDWPEEADNSYTAGSGTYFDGQFLSSTSQWFGPNVPTYRGTVKMNGAFNKRGIQIFVEAPFMYSAGPVAIEGEPGAQPWANLVGNTLGEVTGVQSGYVNVRNSIFFGGATQEQTTGDCHGNLSETRTALYSTTGNLKLISSVEGAGIEVGAEVEVGFTVERKTNSNTLYTFDGTFEIYVSTFGSYRTFSSFHATSYGLQRN